jgi:hypothetical protein
MVKITVLPNLLPGKTEDCFVCVERENLFLRPSRMLLSRILTDPFRFVIYKFLSAYCICNGIALIYSFKMDGRQ